MEVIPAIDFRGGKVVRLLRGEYRDETVYSDDPVAIARRWEARGAKTIHLVDLEGARDGEMKNREAIEKVVRAMRARTELGGGLRDLPSIERALIGIGVSRVILGSVLLEKPELAIQAAERFPQRIILGIDARDGLVATRGWRETSSVKAIDLVREFYPAPIAAVIYTDIARDGTLEGPNLEAVAEIAAVCPYPLIASGGIGDLGHIRALAAISRSVRPEKIIGVIVGKALYDGKFTLEEAMQAAG